MCWMGRLFGWLGEAWQDFWNKNRCFFGRHGEVVAHRHSFTDYNYYTCKDCGKRVFDELDYD